MKENTIISTLRKEIRENGQRLRVDILEQIHKEFSPEFADLHDMDNRIIMKLFELKDRVAHIEEVMSTKDDIQRLESSMGELVTIVKKMDSDRYAMIEWLKRHDIHLENLDMRVATLEA